MAFAANNRPEGKEVRLPMVLSRKAIVFIAAVLYLVLGHWLGFLTVNAAILLWLGFEWFRRDNSRWAFALMAVCALIILIHQIELFVAIVLISLAMFLARGRPASAKGNTAGRHGLYLAMRQEDETWLLHSFASWHLVGEVRLDLTRAVPEEQETTLVLQGIAGDVDLIVPEDWGVNIDASVLVGQIKWRSPDAAGVNRLTWRSPDYEHRPVRVNVQVLYMIGDIKIMPG
jgi:lia operon protein LiaF